MRMKALTTLAVAMMDSLVVDFLTTVVAVAIAIADSILPLVSLVIPLAVTDFHSLSEKTKEAVELNHAVLRLCFLV